MATTEEADLADELASRWVGFAIVMGVALVAVVAAQVIASIVEGLTVSAHKLEPTGIKTDLLHRIGFPFGNLGPPTALFLLAGLVLVCLPTLLGQDMTPMQDRLVSIALIAVLALSAIMAVGSVLAVRNSLHEYTGRNQAVPTYARVGFGSFLVATLGTLAATVFGAVSALGSRRRRR